MLYSRSISKNIRKIINCYHVLFILEYKKVNGNICPRMVRNIMADKRLFRLFWADTTAYVTLTYVVAELCFHVGPIHRFSCSPQSGFNPLMAGMEVFHH